MVLNILNLEISTPFIMDVLSLILVLAAFLFIYRIAIRTEKELGRGSLYILLSLIILGLTKIIGSLNIAKIMQSSILAELILEFLFLFLLVIGLWYLQKGICEIELKTLSFNNRNKKNKIKHYRKRRKYR